MTLLLTPRYLFLYNPMRGLDSGLFVSLIQSANSREEP